MRCPSLIDLPPAPPDKSGWPWTVESPQLPQAMPDGNPWPRISIVTPSFNQGQFLEETIRSVLLQGYPGIEYFIMDGGSTDNSVAIIRKYARWITHWRTGPDDGQADAINKALALASGIWFHNVNADDILVVGSLACVGVCDPQADLIAVPVENFEGDVITITQNRNLNTLNLLRIYGQNASCSWHQPGIILKREMLFDIGGYPIQFDYIFDYAAICRYLELYKNIVYLDKVLVRFRIHELSKTRQWDWRHDQEEVDARHYLAGVLKSPSLRRIAQKEAKRRRLRNRLASEWNAALSLHLLRDVALMLIGSPYLVVDRMLLFYFRRKFGLAS